LSANEEHYTITAVEWKRTLDQTVLDPTSPFEPGSAYTITVTLDAATDYAFSTNIGTTDDTAIVNGDGLASNVSVEFVTGSNNQQIKLTYAFTPLNKPIESAGVSGLVPPVHTAPPSCDGAALDTLGTEYAMTGCAIVWKDPSNEVLDYNDPDDKFEYGKAYKAYVTLTAKDGYTFTGFGTSNINQGGSYSDAYSSGGSVGFTDVSSDSLTLVYTFTTAKAPIESAGVSNIDPPATNETPDTLFDVETDAKYTAQIAWTDDSNVSWTEDDIYVAEKTYVLTVTLTPFVGYTFGAVALTLDKATVNGYNATTCVLDGDNLVLTYVFPETSYIAITAAAVTGITEPIAHREPVPSGSVDISENYTFVGISWADANSDPVSEFVAELTYTARVELAPKTGYTFEGFALANATINTASVTGINGNAPTDDAHIFLEVQFTAAREKLSAASVSLSVTHPVAHDLPVFALTNNADTVYSVPDDSVLWSDPNDINWLDTMAFVFGKAYLGQLTLSAIDGYSFAGFSTGDAPDMVVTDTYGVSALSVVVTDVDAVADTITIAFEFEPLAGAITSVSVTGIDTPVAGVEPDVTARLTEQNGAPYATAAQNSVVWSPAAVTFAHGIEYAVTVTLSAVAGYTFEGIADIADAVVFVDDLGESHVVSGDSLVIEDDGATLTLTYTFAATPKPPDNGSDDSDSDGVVDSVTDEDDPEIIFIINGATLTVNEVRRGDEITVKVTGLKRNTYASAFVYSDPVNLGEQQVDGNGEALWVWTVPDDFEVREHEVTVVRDGGVLASTWLKVFESVPSAPTGGSVR
jgi:hypothetical protein